MNYAEEARLCGDSHTFESRWGCCGNVAPDLRKRGQGPSSFQGISTPFQHRWASVSTCPADLGGHERAPRLREQRSGRADWMESTMTEGSEAATCKTTYHVEMRYNGG